jgi:hypothetical protein
MTDKVYSNRWTTAEDLFHDKIMIVPALMRMLTEECLNVYPEISNKMSRILQGSRLKIGRKSYSVTRADCAQKHSLFFVVFFYGTSI